MHAEFRTNVGSDKLESYWSATKLASSASGTPFSLPPWLAQWGWDCAAELKVGLVTRGMPQITFAAS